MAIPACEPSALMADAACLDCIDSHGLLAIIARILCRASGMSCDPSVLAEESKCLRECLDSKALLAIIAQQLCEIKDAGIPIGFAQQVYSGAGAPVAPPTDPNIEAIYYDTADEFTQYDWDVNNQVWV